MYYADTWTCTSIVLRFTHIKHNQCARMMHACVINVHCNQKSVLFIPCFITFADKRTSWHLQPNKLSRRTVLARIALSTNNVTIDYCCIKTTSFSLNKCLLDVISVSFCFIAKLRPISFIEKS